MRSLEQESNSNQDGGEEKGAHAIFPSSVQAAMSLGGYLNMVSKPNQESDELDLVEMMLNFHPDKVDEYIRNQGEPKGKAKGKGKPMSPYQAAEELIEDYEMNDLIQEWRAAKPGEKCIMRHGA